MGNAPARTRDVLSLSNKPFEERERPCIGEDNRSEREIREKVISNARFETKFSLREIWKIDFLFLYYYCNQLIFITLKAHKKY